MCVWLLARMQESTSRWHRDRELHQEKRACDLRRALGKSKGELAVQGSKGKPGGSRGEQAVRQGQVREGSRVSCLGLECEGR